MGILYILFYTLKWGSLKSSYTMLYVSAVQFITSDLVQNRASLKLNEVIDAYEHALLGKYPRARYVVGADARFFDIPLTWLPEFVTDWILRKLNSLTAFPKPATRIRD